MTVYYMTLLVDDDPSTQVCWAEDVLSGQRDILCSDIPKDALILDPDTKEPITCELQ